MSVVQFKVSMRLKVIHEAELVAIGSDDFSLVSAIRRVTIDYISDLIT